VKNGYFCQLLKFVSDVCLEYLCIVLLCQKCFEMKFYISCFLITDSASNLKGILVTLQV